MNAVAHTPPEAPAPERPSTEEGVLLEAMAEPLPAATLADRLATPIAAHLERAAWWPDHDGRCGPRLGECSGYLIAFKSRDYRTLYVRFESEPFSDARLEVSSSMNDPDLDATAPDDVRKTLLRRGFKPGGGRAGFWRPQGVQSEEDCRVTAAAIAGLMIDGLHYDPRYKVLFKLERHQRAKPEPVLKSLSFGDIGRLLSASGLVVWKEILPSGRLAWRVVDPPRFHVLPYAEVAPDSGLYGGIWFGFTTRFTPEQAEAVLREVSPSYVYGDMTARDNGDFAVFQGVALAGGVTEAHLKFHLRLWRKLLKHVVETGRAEVDDD